MVSVIVVGVRPELMHLKGFFLSHNPNEYLVIDTKQHDDPTMMAYENIGLSKPHMTLVHYPEPFNMFLGMMTGMKKLYNEVRYDEVYVIGDTNTTLATALASSLMGLKVHHMEAGMRCNNMTREEINRRCVDSMSDILYAYTDYAVRNLESEKVHGNIVRTPNYKIEGFKSLIPIAEKLDPQPLGHNAVMTLHRAENVDDPKRLEYIMGYLAKEDRTILFPIHPRTSQRLEEYNIKLPSNVIASKPLEFLDFIKVILDSDKVYTDSGGASLEAFTLKKDLVIFRDTMEWEEIDNATFI